MILRVRSVSSICAILGTEKMALSTYKKQSYYNFPSTPTKLRQLLTEVKLT